MTPFGKIWHSYGKSPCSIGIDISFAKSPDGKSVTFNLGQTTVRGHCDSKSFDCSTSAVAEFFGNSWPFWVGILRSNGGKPNKETLSYLLLFFLGVSLRKLTWLPGRFFFRPLLQISWQDARCCQGKCRGSAVAVAIHSLEKEHLAASRPTKLWRPW